MFYLFVYFFVISIIVRVVFNYVDSNNLIDHITTIISILIYLLLYYIEKSKNATNENNIGVLIILEMIFSSNVNLNKVSFILFDNEQIGNLGSKTFFEKYPETIKKELIDLRRYEH